MTLISDSAFIASLLAGFFYIFSPGPVFVSILSLVCDEGRRAGVRFAMGAFIGDALWIALTYLFLIGASSVSPMLLVLINAFCGIYLLFLAWKMTKSALLGKTAQAGTVSRSYLQGIMLGVMNPKSYPVAISLFTALLKDDKNALALGALPMLMFSAILGIVLAYWIEIVLAGLDHFRDFYKTHTKIFQLAFAAIFALFGVNLLWGIG